jgi:chemotaxis protein methyltransferase CheR
MDYDGFKTEVFKLTGIDLSCYKEKQMKRRIDSLISKNGISNYRDYIGILKTDHARFNEFINYLTINVSEFYRNPEQWEILEKEILPLLLGRNKNLRIWSAACSTGDEPYTLVMVLNKFLPLRSIKIIATDIDKEALEKAKTGLYTYKSLEKLPYQFQTKYFLKTGDFFRIKDEIKDCVDFRQHNLLKDNYPEGFDLIVCRNVLIYFTEEAKNEIYKKFNRALNAKGVLFVGSTEQIIMSSKFKLLPLKTFFYVKEGEI